MAKIRQMCLYVLYNIPARIIVKIFHQLGRIMAIDAKFLHNKKLLGVDFGEKVIGTALYAWGVDPYPMPFEKVINTNEKSILEHFSKIIDEEFIEVIVIGVPYLLDGKSTSTTKKAKDFLTWIQNKFPTLKCIEQDETLTTFEAKDRMIKSPRYNFKVDLKHIDTLSAAIILESFVERVNHES